MHVIKKEEHHEEEGEVAEACSPVVPQWEVVDPQGVAIQGLPADP